MGNMNSNLIKVFSKLLRDTADKLDAGTCEISEDLAYDVIVKTFDIENYSWRVHIYIGMDTYYIELILNDLNVIGCPKQLMKEIEDKMIENKLNTGFTYSKGHYSVIVTAPTTNPKQTINSLTHEIRHLVDDIAKTEKLDPYGEDVAYLTGETMMLLVDELKMILSK